MKQVKIQFPGIGSYSREWLSTHSDKAQNILEQCKGEQPICFCRAKGVRMYIAYYKQYILKRIPNSGPEHAPFCESYEPDASLSGLGDYAKGAVTERADGQLSVRLGVPLQMKSTVDSEPGDTPSREGSSGGIRAAKRDSVKLNGLLNLLWEESQFNRWSPKMENRRHYNQIHKFLLAAASRVLVHRKHLTDHLYIPEPFYAKEGTAIDQRRNAILRRLTVNSRNEPKRMLVLGQVKQFSTSEHGYGVQLAHTPSYLMFWYDEKLHRRIEKAIAFANTDVHHLNDQLPIFLLMSVERNRKRVYEAKDIGVLVTTPEYIPVTSGDEAVVAHRLIENKRYFYKPMAYDAKQGGFPNFLLRDVGEVAAPLEILGEKDSDRVIETRNNRINHYEEDRSRYWVWDVFSCPEPPKFLPPNNPL